MLYRIPQLIEHVSGIMTLEEGDLILTGASLPPPRLPLPRHLARMPSLPSPTATATGTPQGVGPIAEGDKVTAGLEKPDGTVLDHLEHVVKAREGGYEFKGK